VACFHLGMRLGELRNLKWEQVDFDGAVIRLQAKQTKGKRARTAPIYGDLKPFLEMQRDTQCDTFRNASGYSTGG
jgi:integrase